MLSYKQKVSLRDELIDAILVGNLDLVLMILPKVIDNHARALERTQLEFTILTNPFV